MKQIILATACAAIFAGPALADAEHNHGETAEQHDEHGMDHGPDHGMDHGMDHGAMAAGTTVPADGAILTEAPAHLMIQFGHPMQIDRVTLTTLTGEVIALDVAELGQTDHLMLALPTLQPDDYTADWRAKGEDGHVMSGAFSFTVE